MNIYHGPILSGLANATEKIEAKSIAERALDFRQGAVADSCRSTMGHDEGKSRGFSGNQQSQFHYGTFQGVANYNPPTTPPHPVLSHYNPTSPVVGFPQPVTPPGLSAYSCGFNPCQFKDILQWLKWGRPVRDGLPCCGLGFGWLAGSCNLFISGFFLSAIPWYIGALVVCLETREKPGYVACLMRVISVLFYLFFVVAKGLVFTTSMLETLPSSI